MFLNIIRFIEVYKKSITIVTVGSTIYLNKDLPADIQTLFRDNEFPSSMEIILTDNIIMNEDITKEHNIKGSVRKSTTWDKLPEPGIIIDLEMPEINSNAKKFMRSLQTLEKVFETKRDALASISNQSIFLEQRINSKEFLNDPDLIQKDLNFLKNLTKSVARSAEQSMQKGWVHKPSDSDLLQYQSIIKKTQNMLNDMNAFEQCVIQAKGDSSNVPKTYIKKILAFWELRSACPEIQDSTGYYNDFFKAPNLTILGVHVANIEQKIVEGGSVGEEELRLVLLYESQLNQIIDKNSLHFTQDRTTTTQTRLDECTSLRHKLGMTEIGEGDVFLRNYLTELSEKISGEKAAQLEAKDRLLTLLPPENVNPSDPSDNNNANPNIQRNDALSKLQAIGDNINKNANNMMMSEIPAELRRVEKNIKLLDKQLTNITIQEQPKLHDHSQEPRSNSKSHEKILRQDSQVNAIRMPPGASSAFLDVEDVVLDENPKANENISPSESCFLEISPLNNVDIENLVEPLSVQARHRVLTNAADGLSALQKIQNQGPLYLSNYQKNQLQELASRIKNNYNSDLTNSYESEEKVLENDAKENATIQKFGGLEPFRQGYYYDIHPEEPEYNHPYHIKERQYRNDALSKLQAIKDNINENLTNLGESEKVMQQIQPKIKNIKLACENIGQDLKKHAEIIKSSWLAKSWEFGKMLGYSMGIITVFYTCYYMLPWSKILPHVTKIKFLVKPIVWCFSKLKQAFPLNKITPSLNLDFGSEAYKYIENLKNLEPTTTGGDLPLKFMNFPVAKFVKFIKNWIK